MKQNSLLLLIIFLFISLIPLSAEPITLDVSNGNIIITEKGYTADGSTTETDYQGDYVIIGETRGNTVTVESGAHNITLQGVNINVGGCAFTIKTGATVYLTLVGSSLLDSESGQAGLNVQSRATLVITKDSEEGGSLEANGGMGAAGIGGNRNSSCGTVIINGGTITAKGCFYSIKGEGAGIGCGHNGGNDPTCERIIINGGVVTASADETYYDYAADIGGGSGRGNAADITITGGVVRGSIGAGLWENNGKGKATIHIKGGLINGGFKGNCTVTIDGGSINNRSEIYKNSAKEDTYQGELKAAGVSSISVDNEPFLFVETPSDEEQSYYLHMTGKDHDIAVRNKDGQVQMYKAVWNDNGKSFTISAEETASTLTEPSSVAFVDNQDQPYTITFGDKQLNVKVNITSQPTTMLRSTGMNSLLLWLTDSSGKAMESFRFPAGEGEQEFTLDLQPLNAGDYTLHAQYGGSSTTLEPTEAATAKLTVTKAQSSISFTNNGEFTKTYGESKQIVSATKTGSTKEIKYTYYIDEDCITSIEQPTDAGEYWIKAAVEADKNYQEAVTATSAKLTITPKELVVKVKGWQYVYQDELDSYVVQYSYEGNVEGEEPKFEGQLAFDEQSGECSQGTTFTLLDNDNFKANNYIVKVEGSVDIMDIKTTEAEAEIYDETEYGWVGEYGYIMAPDGFTVRIEGDTDTGSEYCELEQSGIYTYELLRFGEMKSRGTVRIDVDDPTIEGPDASLLTGANPKAVFTFKDATSGIASYAVYRDGEYNPFAEYELNPEEADKAQKELTYTFEGEPGEYTLEIEAVDLAGMYTWNDFTFTLTKDYAITIANNITGGTVTVDKARAVAGEEVKLTATPTNEDYEFESWVVTTVGGTSVAVVDNSFKMPAEDVTVSAEFSYNPYIPDPEPEPEPDPEPEPTPDPEPDPEPEPAFYTLVLPEVVGATLSPSAGTYTVQEGNGFSFSLTLDADYNQSVPVVKAGDRELTPGSDGKYRITDVTSDLTITITGIIQNAPAGTAEVDAPVKVWKDGNTLYVYTAERQTIRIYTFGGQLYKAATGSGEQCFPSMPDGHYIIAVGERIYKVAF